MPESIKCVHLRDEKGQCFCPSHKRSGDLARFFGPRPACILIGAAKNVECKDRIEPTPAMQTGVSGTVWDQIGDDRVDLNNLLEDELS